QEYERDNGERDEGKDAGRDCAAGLCRSPGQADNGIAVAIGEVDNAVLGCRRRTISDPQTFDLQMTANAAEEATVDIFDREYDREGFVRSAGAPTATVFGGKRDSRPRKRSRVGASSRGKSADAASPGDLERA